MSADNGYVIRKNTDGKYVLQMYFDSAESYPLLSQSPWSPFDTLEDAVLHYEKLDDAAFAEGYPLCEYGLSVHTKETTKE